MLLDFATTGHYKGVDVAVPVRQMLETVVPQLERLELIKPNQSLGVVVGNPEWKGRYHEVWDAPEELVWFVCGWGPEAERYISNGLRKNRARARENKDTLWIRQSRPELFVDVQTPDDPTNLHSDFPWGGSTEVRDILTGVSALTEEEDDMLSRFVGSLVATEMAKIDAREA